MEAHALRVLLARLNAEERLWSANPERVCVGRWTRVPDDLVLPLVEVGLVELAGSDSDGEYVTLTAAGSEALAALVPEDLCWLPVGIEWSPSRRAGAALWLWLVVRGGVRGGYSATGTNRYDDNGEIMHLLACGLDLSCSTAVRDDSWSTFTGTFADDGQARGVGGQATCRCGEVEDLRLLAEVESVTELLRQVLVSGVR
jgi:hypothetical protein